MFNNDKEEVNSMKSFFKKWCHALLGLYLFVYLAFFNYLESTVTTDFHIIHCALDDKIPFCEFFIIPYFIWFGFIAAACVYFFLRSQKECVQYGLYLIIGMSIAIAIYFIYPNGLNLRPEVFVRDNFATRMVAHLYSIDTPTNVWPSLHVFNTLATMAAVFKSKTFGKYHTPVKIVTSIIAFFICISTVFLKQHSILDVVAAVILAALLYPVIYVRKKKN